MEQNVAFATGKSEIRDVDEPHVPAAMMSLLGNLDQCFANLEQLANRLDPVRVPAPEGVELKPSGDPQAPRSPLAGELELLNQRVVSLANSIVALRFEVDL